MATLYTLYNSLELLAVIHLKAKEANSFPFYPHSHKVFVMAEALKFIEEASLDMLKVNLGDEKALKAELEKAANFLNRKEEVNEDTIVSTD